MDVFDSRPGPDRTDLARERNLSQSGRGTALFRRQQDDMVGNVSLEPERVASAAADFLASRLARAGDFGTHAASAFHSGGHGVLLVRVPLVIALV